MRTRSSKVASLRLRVNRFAPALSIALMLGASFLMANPVAYDQNIVDHRARIAEEMAVFPFQLGQWVGQDVPVPTTAVEILRPNSLVSRRYSRLGTSESVVLAFIHCSDLRDMMGHYPPVCYPATGWTLHEDSVEDVPVSLAGGTAFMRLYRFYRFDDIGLERQQVVLSMFLLPDDLLLTDMEDLRGRSTRGRSMSATGVAQLQLVFAEDPATSSIASQASEMLAAVPPALISALNAPIYPETSDPMTGNGSDR